MPAVNLAAFDFLQLPSAEDDRFEFKSSATPFPDLKKKLSCAVSAFGNSGGGYFVAGVDARGNADGGFPLTVGRQGLRDWADQVIHQVQPAPAYEIDLIDDPVGRGFIHKDSAVLVVSIGESHAAPHMALDNCYYIRAGAHTVAARHFIVEAIWAKRHVSKPRLSHVFRPKPDNEEIIQLGVIALTNSPAIDVGVEMLPRPELMKGLKEFPLHISVVDQHNPLFFDVTTRLEAEKKLGPDTGLCVTYHDLTSNRYRYERTINPAREVSSLRFINDDMKNIVAALQSIDATIRGRPR